ncbi:haloacid dehalogenase-like hydrolase [Taibaiella soli]|uniref:Haloacid dehalogenase-like hydrolase n=2 Tax=Taibaiella soli TaxID=1649169 RepID=A0A2W2AJ39_9BACT|nr:haloacid dehalogenase-like hydrolase [Taibaiella soli]
MLAGALLTTTTQSCQPSGDNKTDTTKAADKTTSDPLPSWNDGALKQSIIAYVTKVTKQGSPDFIPEEARMATFDNDGTLWAEQPLVQELFAYYMAGKMMEKNPALAQKQPFKAIAEKDKAYFQKNGEKALLEVVISTQAGMSEDDYEAAARAFFSTAHYPRPEVPIKNITYQPQIELLTYLRANGFKTFLCSGGDVDFMRVISKDYYGIPKEQVIGTMFQYEFIDSNRTNYRKQALWHFNDQKKKPVGIQIVIGQRPVFACGNERSGGDIAMLEYCQSNKYASFQMIINHDDSVREFFYQEKDTASLKAAAKNNWHVASMKNDWKTIFTK